MVFSDDDLKRLGKECDEISADIAASLFPGGIRFGIRLTKHCHAVKDLIARLEAAEEAVMFMWISEHPIDESGKEAYEAWRKAAGKGGK